MSNTEIWDKVSRVPPEHLKGFQRAGGFRGTAIKPMWSIHRMTEVYGPVGQGWGMDSPEFQTITVGEEVLVYCTVAVWANHINGEGPRFYGVGGDKVAAKGSSGLRTDDEAFKKAYTDALTNALKLLGVGADVHMGLWDGNKYIDEKPEAKAPEPDEPPPEAVRPFDHSPIVKEAYKVLDVMLNRIHETGTLEDLQQFWLDNAKTIKDLPAAWKKELTAKKDDIKAALAEKAAA